MIRRFRFGRCSSLVMLAGLTAAGFAVSGFAVPGMTTAIAQDEAAAQHSGSSVQLQRMILLLQGSDKQRTALDTLLAAQQAQGNASFHKWLKPGQFADRFGLSEADTATVAGWLRGQGFTVAALPAGRGWIEFSGTVGQVERAFGATVTVAGLNASGEARYRLSGEIKLPVAIAPMVKGLVSLDGSVAAVASTAAQPSTEAVSELAAIKSLAVAQAKADPLTPSLAKEWLKLASSTTAGAGESIAIPSRSNVRLEDFASFRKSFGLPEAPLTVHLQGADPGRTDEEAAAMQAASWAGVAAPGARIVLVPVASTNATDGVDLAMAASIDGVLAHTVSVGFTACESGMSAAHQAFYASLYRQAAAEGIAVIAATGDSGAAACHRPEDGTAVQSGFAVNGLASTPWNTAVGAIAFIADGGGLTGWRGLVSQPGLASLPGSTTVQGASSTANFATGYAMGYATGGGASRVYDTPAWQAAAGLPASDPATEAAHHRYLPDVSLPTAVDGIGGRGLAFCFSGETLSDSCRLVSAGGSGASAAVFAGLAALLAQTYGPQGNLAPRLYAMRQSEAGAATRSTASAFVDVTAGNARLRCVAGSPDCGLSSDSPGEIGFSAGDGYDLASGLGSINAGELVKEWATPAVVGTAAVTVVMTNVAGVTYSPATPVTLSAQVTANSGVSVPTGTVQFYDETIGLNIGTPATLAANGTASFVETGLLTAGGHNIVAQYSGDTIYEAATSAPVEIEIQLSPTSTVVTPSTTLPAVGGTIVVTGVVTSTSTTTVSPTGTLTINVDSVAQGSALVATTGTTTSASVNVTIATAGAHTIQGIYSGDANFSTSTSPSVTVTAAKTATVTTIAATPSTIGVGVPETFTATVAPASPVTGTTYVLTGTVSFFDGGTTLLGTVAVSSNTAILAGITLSASTSHTVTAVYSGDATYSTSASSALLLEPTLLPVTVTLTESNTVIAPGQPVTLTATITPVNPPPVTAEQHPSGYVLFYAGTTLISGQVPVLEAAGYSSVASTIVPHIAAGSYVVTAQYSGDPTYGAAISNSLNLQAQDFTISCAVNNINVIQGDSQDVTCAVASLGGLTGPIQVACAEQNPPQNGPIDCTFNPNIVTTSGSTVLTVVTKRGGSTLARESGPRPIWPAAGGGVALAFLGLLLSPIGRRARWLRSSGGKPLVLALLLAGLAGAGLGCGNTVTLTSTQGTPLGVHTLKLTAGADVGTVTVTHNAYLTVNVTP